MAVAQLLGLPVVLLSLSGVEKAYGPSLVLSNVSLVLNPGDSAGLVGANGAGKSTLLRIAAGELAADAGECRVGPGVVAAYLPQQPPEPAAGTTIDDLVYEAVGGLRAMEQRMGELEVEIAAGGREALEEYGALQEAFERRGGYELHYRLDEVLAGLGIAQIARGRAFETLSGGEKVRVLLAVVLLRSPDVLLLDEPTNHLDVRAISWLENYLGGFRGGILAVSHDRRFLNAIANRIVEIDEHSHTAREYAGSYDAYAAGRARERERWAEEYERQQEELAGLRRAIRVDARQAGHANRAARDNDKFARGFFGGRHDVALSRNVRAAEEKIRRIEAAPVPRPPQPLRVTPEFDAEGLGGRRVLSVEGLVKAYGGRHVLEEVSFELDAGARVVIVGANGTGKSTLLDILAGRKEADRGEVRWAPSARVGYLDQDGAELDPARTLIELYGEGRKGHREELVNELFRYGLFRLEDLSKAAGALSTGERRKLQLARLMATRANVLLLDEPTNHLAFDILEEFERALVSFPGPVVAVSHDRWFIERFGGETWRLADGRLLR